MNGTGMEYANEFNGIMEQLSHLNHPGKRTQDDANDDGPTSDGHNHSATSW